MTLMAAAIVGVAAGVSARADNPPPPVANDAPPPAIPVQPLSLEQVPPAQPPAAVQPPPLSAVQSVAPDTAEAILGQPVTDPDKKEIGRLVDVLVDANGQPQAAVIDFGGFMGVGNRKIAVHWSVLRFTPGDTKHKITVTMTPDQIKAAPEFLDPNKAASVVTPADSVAAGH